MLSCSPGYYLLGRRLIQCRTNGTWSVGNERPSCKGKEHTSLQNILCFLMHIFYFINSLKFFKQCSAISVLQVNKFLLTC